MEIILAWIKLHTGVIFAAFGGAVVHFIVSDASWAKRASSALAGLIMALILSEPLANWLHIVEYNYLIGAILALSGQWVAEFILIVVKKFSKTKVEEQLGVKLDDNDFNK